MPHELIVYKSNQLSAIFWMCLTDILNICTEKHLQEFRLENLIYSSLNLCDAHLTIQMTLNSLQYNKETNINTLETLKLTGIKQNQEASTQVVWRQDHPSYSTNHPQCKAPPRAPGQSQIFETLHISIEEFSFCVMDRSSQSGTLVVVLSKDLPVFQSFLMLVPKAKIMKGQTDCTYKIHIQSFSSYEPIKVPLVPSNLKIFQILL